MDGSDVAVLALGPVAYRAMEAAARIKEETGKSPMVYNVRFLKPIDPAMMEDAAKCSTLITLEDGTLKGGLYSELWNAQAQYYA